MPGALLNYPGRTVLGSEQIGPVDSPDGTLARLSAIGVSGAQPMNIKNKIIGGCFSVNPWQRGTSVTSIADTLTYTADRFFAVGGASSSITVSRQAITAGDLPDNGAGLYALQFQRAASNADTAVIKLGTALDTLNSFNLAGKTVALSFYAKAGANFSAVGSKLGILLATGTGADGSAANLASGGWAGYLSRTLYTVDNAYLPYGSNVGGNPPTTLVQSPAFTAVDGVSLSTTWKRYFVVATIPQNAQQVGVVFSYTPVGTAGANDWVQFAGIQLELVDNSLPFPTPLEARAPQVELLLCQRYFYRLSEKGSAAAVQANGMISATNVQTVCIPLPVKMRTTPAVTVSAGTWRYNVAGTLTAVGGGFAAGAAATQSPEAIVVVGALTATVGQATQLVSGAATWGGYIDASAEL